MSNILLFKDNDIKERNFEPSDKINQLVSLNLAGAHLRELFVPFLVSLNLNSQSPNIITSPCFDPAIHVVDRHPSKSHPQHSEYVTAII